MVGRLEGSPAWAVVRVIGFGLKVGGVLAYECVARGYMSVEKTGREKSEPSCMKRGNLVRGACGGKVRRSAARSGKPLRLLLVDGSLVRGGGGGGKGGERRQNCRSTSCLSCDSLKAQQN